MLVLIVNSIHIWKGYQNGFSIHFFFCNLQSSLYLRHRQRHCQEASDNLVEVYSKQSRSTSLFLLHLPIDNRLTSFPSACCRENCQILEFYCGKSSPAFAFNFGMCLRECIVSVVKMLFKRWLWVIQIDKRPPDSETGTSHFIEMLF